MLSLHVAATAYELTSEAAVEMNNNSSTTIQARFPASIWWSFITRSRSLGSTQLGNSIDNLSITSRRRLLIEQISWIQLRLDTQQPFIIYFISNPFLPSLVIITLVQICSASWCHRIHQGCYRLSHLPLFSYDPNPMGMCYNKGFVSSYSSSELGCWTGIPRTRMVHESRRFQVVSPNGKSSFTAWLSPIAVWETSVRTYYVSKASRPSWMRGKNPKSWPMFWTISLTFFSRATLCIVPTIRRRRIVALIISLESKENIKAWLTGPAMFHSNVNTEHLVGLNVGRWQGVTSGSVTISLPWTLESRPAHSARLGQ